MLKHLNLALLTFSLSALVWADAADLTLLPDENWQPLYEVVDADLQQRLQRRLVQNPKWQKLIAQKKLAVGVVDMSGTIPRYARVNGNEMMYAASLPKIAVLLAAYVSFEDGSLKETPELHRDLADMIRVSSNTAATRVIDKVGLKKIQTVLADPQFGFYEEARGGGLWVGKRYASTGVRRGDPMHNISHGATVTQVSRFYYLLAHGKLINPERSKQMLADLADPKLHHKFVSQLDKLAPLAKLFRKSGTWRDWHSDSVMVWGEDWRNYILVAMVESPDGGKIIAELVPTVESLIRQAPEARKPRATGL